ncbi:hypothetical protein B0H13DRAFT_1899284 [Mycena leptocephala]|nr:hypothetical protein B0H13DRAFT_1899284 [Mycena leptocephala]
MAGNLVVESHPIPPLFRRRESYCAGDSWPLDSGYKAMEIVRTILESSWSVSFAFLPFQLTFANFSQQFEPVMDPEFEGLLHINPPTDLRTLEIQSSLDGTSVETKEI